MPLAAPVSPPLLFEGNCLSSDEFLRRWEEMADLRHAELIEGIVYMSSPVSNHHDGCHVVLTSCLETMPPARRDAIPASKAPGGWAGPMFPSRMLR